MSIYEKSTIANFSIVPFPSIRPRPGSFFNPLPFNSFHASATPSRISSEAYKFDNRTQGDGITGWSFRSCLAQHFPASMSPCSRHEDRKLPETKGSWPKGNFFMYSISSQQINETRKNLYLRRNHISFFHRTENRLAPHPLALHDCKLLKGKQTLRNLALLPLSSSSPKAPLPSFETHDFKIKSWYSTKQDFDAPSCWIYHEPLQCNHIYHTCLHTNILIQPCPNQMTKPVFHCVSTQA